ncbi:MAG: DNA-binding protein, partial [Veillonella sp. DORA_A_3_16_22]
LADKSGLAQSYISDLESGAIDPRWSTIYRVVSGLGQMSVQDFLNGPQTIRSLRIH